MIKALRSIARFKWAAVPSGFRQVVYLALLMSGSAFGQTNWTDGKGDWFAGGNWSAGTPSAGVVAQINNDGTAQILAPGALAKGVTLGGLGSGYIQIGNGGTLITTADNQIGVGTGVTGMVTVDGAGSSWQLGSGVLFLGSRSTGVLQIFNGATVTGSDAVLSNFAGAIGVATVSGTGSTWTNKGTVGVGGVDEGTLLILAGGKLASVGSYIGGELGVGSPQTQGAVTIDGANSIWTNTGDLTVGEVGIGTLSISRGGNVSNVNGIVGFDTASKGTVSVDGLGGGAIWTNSGNLAVGSFGTGVVVVKNGGVLSDVIGNIGAVANSSGTVTVDGAGGASTWSNTGNLTVGDNGTGVLNIVKGGLVTNGRGIIGGSAGSDGTVNVSGNGVAGASTWSSSDELDIGNSGTGRLTITAGGTVSSGGDTIVGSGSSSTGTASVDGAGSTLSGGTLLAVGGAGGTGTLNVTNGGTATSPIFYAGFGPGANGTVTVSGAGSTLTATGSGASFVGVAGTGVLNLVTGGTFQVSDGPAGRLVLGLVSGASGTLNFGNGGAPGILNAGLIQGGDGLGGGGTAIVNFNHNSSGYYLTLDGTSTGSPIQITGKTSVNQIGPGTTFLVRDYAYTGPTTVSAGRLLLSGFNSSLAAASAVTVNSGGTFGGTGTAFGAVGVANGGILTPGVNGPGTITVGSLTLNNSAQLNYDLGTPGVIGAGINDLTAVNGNLTLDGVLNVTRLSGFGPGTYRIFNYGGALVDQTLDLGSLPFGYTYSIQELAGQVNLVVTPNGANSFWNGSHTVPNGAINGGTGTWDNTTTNWTDATGTTSGAWAGGNAVFSAAAGRVTLGSNISFTGIEFVTDGYLLQRDAGHLFSLVPSGTAPITTDTAVTTTISAGFSGAGGLNKQGLGTLNLTGTSTITGDLAMDAGIVNIQSGGTFSGAHGFVGLDVGSNAAVAVTASSAWNNSSDLYVGYSGTGVLNILNGGTVTNNNGLIGQNAGSNGTVNVDGSGSSWTSSLSLVVGNSGTGTLSITNGAAVTAHGGATIGNIGTGMVVVDGAGSNWTISEENNFILGPIGNLVLRQGSLMIRNGGSVTSVGGGQIVNASAVVTGAGSILNVQGRFFIGESGVASLSILNGASVVDAISRVGDFFGSGTVTVDGAGSLWDSGGNISGLRVGAFSSDGVLNIQNGGKVIVDASQSLFLAGSSGHVGTLNIGNGGPAGILDAGAVQSGAGTATLNFNHSTAGYYFTTDGTAGGAPVLIGGTTAVNHNGPGTTTLLGTHTYTGVTTINAGTLRVDGSLAAASVVTVNSGGTLGGTGTINGPVTIASGGTLAPGDSPGTLTLGSLVLNSGSQLSYELSTPGVVGGGVNDLTIVNGNLTLAGTLNITALPGFGIGTYRIFNYGGTLTDNGLNVGSSTAQGYAYSVDVGTGSQVNLDVTSNGSLIFWNGAHTTPNNAVNGGSGTWDNTATNWTDAAGKLSGSWGSNTGVFTGSSGTITLGANIGFTNLEFVTDGYIVNRDAGNAFSLSPSGSATITTDAGVSTTINAPFTGTGSLTKAGGGTLTLTAVSNLGGDLTVNAGTLNIGAAGSLTNGNGYVALDAGTIATATITGTNSAWALTKDLYVGAAGNGTLNIQNGGTVSAATGTIFVGFGSGSQGTLAVDGAGSPAGAFHNLVHNNFDVGFAGIGALTVTNGGTVSGATSTIALAPGSSGTATVDGAGSNWNLTGDLKIGNSSNGTLNVQNGGSVKNSNGFLGFNSGATGSATVTGTNSTWTSNLNLNVGYGGTGTVAVQNAGTLVSASGLLGNLAGSSGTVTVEGSGSTWTINGDLFVGSFGTGVVNVRNAGSISVSAGTGQVELSSGKNSTGTLNIGNGGASGALAAATVDGGSGTALLNFNHTDLSYTFAPDITGSVSVNHLGTGTTILTGASTYTGPTAINAGTVRVNGSLGNTAVAVSSGAVLGGSGSIGGAVTIASGGTLAPGNSPGTLTTGALTLNSGSLLNYEFATPNIVGSGVNDLTKVNGSLTLAGTLNVTALPGFGAGTYRIFDYTGALTNNGLTLGAVPGGFSFIVDTSVASEVNLDVAAGGPLFIAYWNDSHTTPNGKVNGGSGLWDNATLNWTNQNGTLSGSWGGAVAIFGGAPGSINLGSDVNFTALQFSTTGYVVNGQGFSLTGVGPVLITTDPNVVASINAIIHAPGGLTKLGTGSLFIDGSIFGNLQLLQGLLGGNFSVSGNFYNAATLSPGQSPGQIHMSGNYAQAATGVLKIEIGGRDINQYDLLSVGGTATLDGTLQLVRLNNFKLKRNDVVTFLTADGGVIGKFATVISDFTSDTILQPTVVYHQNSVALEAMQGLFENLLGLTFNQKSVARALDSAAHDRRANALFDYLDYREINKLPGDLDKIAPEELTAIFTLGVSLAKVQAQNIQRRTDDIRSGSSGFNAANLALNGNGPSYSGDFGLAGPIGPRGDDGKEVKETKAVAPGESRWGVFLSGTGEWVSVGNTDNARGYDLESGGFTLGVDYKVCPHFAIGLAAGYTGTTADLVDRGRVWVNGGKLGLYATTFAGGWYADTAVFGGYNSYDTRRSALQGEARGSTDGGELNALFSTGYDIKARGLTFGPIASFNYTYIGTHEFTEQGSLAPLDVHGGKGESLRTALGFKASYDWKIGGLVLKPELRAAWQHEFGDAAYALDSSFGSGAGNSFLVRGPQQGRDSMLLGAGLAIQCSERCSTYFYYDGELGRRNYQATNVTAGIRITF